MTPDLAIRPSTEWPLVPLKRVLTFRNGEPYPHIESSSGVFPVYGSGGEFARADDFLFSGTSVLFGRKGTVDKPLLVNGKFWCIDTMFYTRLSPEVDARYVHYFALTIPYKLLATDTARPSITQTDLGVVLMPFPPLNWQRALADFLDRETAQIDLMIEANEVMSISLAERQSSLLSTILFPQVQTVNGAREWFGSVEWDAPKLWRHAKITNGSTPRREREDYWDGEFPWLNSSVVNLDAVTEADQFVTETALRECHLPVAPAGSVLVGLTGQGKTRGKATELRLEATINQHMAAVIPDRNFWHPRFLTLALRGAYDELRRISDANGATKGALTCEALAAFRVPMPALKVQQALAQEADAATARTDALIASAKEVTNLLRERREALISAGVTGRIDPETGFEQGDPAIDKEAM